jgi:hypothetical protein
MFIFADHLRFTLYQTLFFLNYFFPHFVVNIMLPEQRRLGQERLAAARRRAWPPARGRVVPPCGRLRCDLGGRLGPHRGRGRRRRRRLGRRGALWRLEIVRAAFCSGTRVIVCFQDLTFFFFFLTNFFPNTPAMPRAQKQTLAPATPAATLAAPVTASRAVAERAAAAAARVAADNKQNLPTIFFFFFF